MSSHIGSFAATTGCAEAKPTQLVNDAIRIARNNNLFALSLKFKDPPFEPVVFGSDLNLLRPVYLDFPFEIGNFSLALGDSLFQYSNDIGLIRPDMINRHSHQPLCDLIRIGDHHEDDQNDGADNHELPGDFHVMPYALSFRPNTIGLPSQQCYKRLQSEDTIQ